jgi:hypothetical protein
MTTSETEFPVTLTIQVPGPVRPRTKYKEHKLMRGEAHITLPFVPFPGLYLTFFKPKKRGLPLTLYLRVRAVEWQITDRRFECVVDEVLGSSVFREVVEARGFPRHESEYLKIERALLDFGFEVITDASNLYKLLRREDGTPLDNESSAKM